MNEHGEAVHVIDILPKETAPKGTLVVHQFKQFDYPAYIMHLPMTCICTQQLLDKHLNTHQDEKG